MFFTQSIFWWMARIGGGDGAMDRQLSMPFPSDIENENIALFRNKKKQALIK